MNYYEHHLGDWAAATAHLSMLEDAAYSRLLRWYYAEEKPVPADLRAACRIARAATEDEREAVRVVLEEFFTLGADGWHQRRADAEIERYRSKSEKARRSATARWNTPAPQCEPGAPSVASRAPSHTDRSAFAPAMDANASAGDANAMLTSNQKPDYSVPDGTGAAAPPADPVKALFDAGVALLRDSGHPEGSARALIGKWRKANPDDQVLGAIERCRALSITDPVSWLNAALTPAAARRTSTLALQSAPNYGAGL